MYCVLNVLIELCPQLHVLTHTFHCWHRCLSFTVLSSLRCAVFLARVFAFEIGIPLWSVFHMCFLGSSYFQDIYVLRKGMGGVGCAIRQAPRQLILWVWGFPGPPMNNSYCSFANSESWRWGEMGRALPQKFSLSPCQSHTLLLASPTTLPDTFLPWFLSMTEASGFSFPAVFPLAFFTLHLISESTFLSILFLSVTLLELSTLSFLWNWYRKGNRDEGEGTGLDDRYVIIRCFGLPCGRAVAGSFSCGWFWGFSSASPAGSPQLWFLDVGLFPVAYHFWPPAPIGPPLCSELTSGSLPWGPLLTPRAPVLWPLC